MHMPEMIDNVSKTVKDDLEATIAKGDRLSVAAACFSIYAYQALRKQLDGIATAYNENAPEFIYFMAIYGIFNEFLEDISEDVLPNEATGFKESKIWKMLYTFQKDAALAIINKLESYNGCILADSVGLGKTFTALAVIKYYENRNRSVLVLCPKKLSDNWNTYKENYVNNPIATDCISEGQNLQDCDYCVNYDIHWNPVRIIQRFGRIDRIGSRNAVIQIVNFWPDLDLDEYLSLKGRVETKMRISVMTASGDDDLINAEEKGDLQYRKAQLKRLQEEVVRRNKLAAGTIGISAGEAVREIQVFEVQLRQRELDKRVLPAIAKAIPYKILFVLIFNDEAQAWMEVFYDETSHELTEI